MLAHLIIRPGKSDAGEMRRWFRQEYNERVAATLKRRILRTGSWQVIKRATKFDSGRWFHFRGGTGEP